jgi:hypothetical protein
MSTIYRKTKFGAILQDSIDELNEKHQAISEDLETRLMLHFDRLFAHALETQVKGKASFYGTCHTYSEPGPSTYSFLLEDVAIKIPHYYLDETAKALRIVCPEYQSDKKTKTPSKSENPKKKKKE